ncbi:MAG: MdtA/MuxA family multidrug efflux RND transporter periplasmic adaptor subunit [Betaproteobacteria bacterium]
MPVPVANRNGPFLRRNWPWLAVFLLVLVAAGAYYYFYLYKAPAAETAAVAGKGKGKGARGGDRPVPVVAAAITTGDVNVYLAGLGTVTPVATVAVRSRIDGQLMRVLFKEGQVVRAGDLLAEIDPRTFQAQLATAEGQMARDQALLKNAVVDFERYRTLLQQDSIAKQQVDTQEALVRQSEATVKIDQAAIDTAKLQLAYTRITAPISGRLGLRQVDPGNMVRSGDANGLVVITQLQPITVIFTLPEDALPQVMAKLRAAAKLPVDAYDRADKVKLAAGTLLTADNQIDPATGTVKLKAIFANSDNALFPSQFVNVRMLIDVKRGAVLVPTAAIQRGTPGTFVYIVNAGNTASVRKIVPGPAQGTFTAVESGLVAGEMVVVDGGDKLREGARVDLGAREAAGKAGARKGGGPGAGTGAAAGGAQGSGGSTAPADRAGKGGGAAGEAGAAKAGAAAGPGAPAAGQGAGKAPDAPAAGGSAGGFQSMTPEERAKRWAETNARIDRGEFGEEIRKLPEDERKQKMRELRQRRDAGGAGKGAQ